MATARTQIESTDRKSVKFRERRNQLAEAALVTLAQLGYARTSLREIAENSAFSHGVLHYYFKDKVDLITCGVWLYKTRCITRYDEIIAGSGDYAETRDAFVDALAETMRQDCYLHRLWYDLRSQALYESDFQGDVSEIDLGLQTMIWRVLTRLGDATGIAPSVAPSLAYAMIDGVFQHCLLRHLSGDQDAVGLMREHVMAILRGLFQ